MTSAIPVGERMDRRSQIVAAARTILESEGPEAVTMRRLGAAVGIRGASIYKHVPDKAAIHAALAIEALTEVATILGRVPETFTDLAGSYRAWAIAHPHLYRIVNNQPLPREELPPGLEERAGAPLIRACNGDVDLARAAWATINGLIDLELANRLPRGADIAAAYAAASRAYMVR